ncbi:hypothetical protein DFH09DRAFT_1185675 [Mycena vulgaris]|nr:hypothetical protein DFH09DRAFT_1185675 [Mycena vulgaris]
MRRRVCLPATVFCFALSLRATSANSGILECPPVDRSGRALSTSQRLSVGDNLECVYGVVSCDYFPGGPAIGGVPTTCPGTLVQAGSNPGTVTVVAPPPSTKSSSTTSSSTSPGTTLSNTPTSTTTSETNIFSNTPTLTPTSEISTFSSPTSTATSGTDTLSSAHISSSTTGTLSSSEKPTDITASGPIASLPAAEVPNKLRSPQIH